MKNKKVAVIILTLNGKEYTKNCLDSIRKNTKYKNYKVILVDNGSIDGTQELIKSKYKWIDLIENKENRGFSGGNNDGIKFAIKKYNPDYFYLLNNDTLVEENWLIEAIKTMNKSKTIGIVGSKQLTFDKKPAISAGWIKVFGVKYYFGYEEKEVGWVSGAGFLVKKDVFKKIGLLDEIYNPAYYEETDFQKRAMNKGIKIYHSPKSIFLHKGGTTKINKDMSELFYRNRYIYFKKYYSFILILPRIITDLVRGIKYKKLNKIVKGYIEAKQILKK